jgi:hypothetical protein
MQKDKNDPSHTCLRQAGIYTPKWVDMYDFIIPINKLWVIFKDDRTELTDSF